MPVKIVRSVRRVASICRTKIHNTTTTHSEHNDTARTTQQLMCTVVVVLDFGNQNF